MSTRRILPEHDTCPRSPQQLLYTYSSRLLHHRVFVSATHRTASRSKDRVVSVRDEKSSVMSFLRVLKFGLGAPPHNPHER